MFPKTKGIKVIKSVSDYKKVQASIKKTGKCCFTGEVPGTKEFKRILDGDK